jgi:hypothetical protein
MESVLSVTKKPYKEKTGTGLIGRSSPRTAVIMHHEGDERNSEFWKTLVSATPDTPVAKVCASSILAANTAVLGYRAYRMEIRFAQDPVTVEDLWPSLLPRADRRQSMLW